VIEAAPAEAIRRSAEEAGADLVVMGTHGRSGFHRLMLGSVAERVLRESDVPVLTVRGGGPPVRNILCPVNRSDAARGAFAAATELARLAGARLTALHVREPGAADSIEDLCAWLKPPQPVECQVRELDRAGEAAREILKLASEQACDLLVVGSQHRRFFDSTVIGSTTARVVRHAPCPVLTVIAKGSGHTDEIPIEEAHHAV
jgi:nucleotide-binding universal stress UspA family protein